MQKISYKTQPTGTIQATLRQPFTIQWAKGPGVGGPCLGLADLPPGDRLTWWHRRCACVGAEPKAHRPHPGEPLSLYFLQFQRFDTWDMQHVKCLNTGTSDQMNISFHCGGLFNLKKRKVHPSYMQVRVRHLAHGCLQVECVPWESNAEPFGPESKRKPYPLDYPGQIFMFDSSAAARCIHRRSTHL